MRGDEYSRPASPSRKKYAWRRSAFGRNSTTELPLSA